MKNEKNHYGEPSKVKFLNSVHAKMIEENLKMHISACQNDLRGGTHFPEHFQPWLLVETYNILVLKII